MIRYGFAQEILDVAGQVAEHFEPFVFYNRDGDCVEAFFDNEDYYCSRVDGLLTLYLDMKTNEITGFMLKDMKSIVSKIKEDKIGILALIEEDKLHVRTLFGVLLKMDGNAVNVDVGKIDRYKAVADLATKNNLEEFEYA